VRLNFLPAQEEGIPELIHIDLKKNKKCIIDHHD
jgi:hypothetical protein